MDLRGIKKNQKALSVSNSDSWADEVEERGGVGQTLWVLEQWPWGDMLRLASFEKIGGKMVVW